MLLLSLILAVSSDPAVLFSLGTQFAQHGQYQQAIDYLRQIPEKDADDAVYFNLGLACSHLRRYDEARGYYFRAIDKHPEHVLAYLRIGLDYAAQGQGRRALPWLFRVKQLAPDRLEVSYALSEQLVQLGYFDTAQQILAQHDHPLLAVAYADLEQAKGDSDAALAAYQQILAEQPGFPPALVGLARAEESNGKTADARSQLLALLSKYPRDPAANSELGSLEARHDDWSAALPHLNEAYAADPSDARIALDLARAHRHLGHPAEALRILTRLAPAMRESSPYHLELAQLYTQLHQPSKAAAERKLVTELQAEAKQGLHFDNPTVYVH